jgi:hypothetical protein
MKQNDKDRGWTEWWLDEWEWEWEWEWKTGVEAWTSAEKAEIKFINDARVQQQSSRCWGRILEE